MAKKIRKRYIKRKRASKKRRMYKRSNRQFWGNPMSKTVPLPKRFKTTLAYQEGGITLNPGVGGTVANYVFSCNGLYDPNITGTGHQPLGFDQFMLMYNHYTVIGAKIRVDYVNTDGTNGACVGIYIKDSSTTTSDYRLIVENGAKYKRLTKTGGDRDSCAMVMNINPPKWLGRSKPLANDNMRGSSAANPQEQVYFHIFASPFDQSTDSGAVQISVKIDYIVVFTEPKELTLS